MHKVQHIHFIGICGVAMAPLAKMFKDMGWRVTGSDKGFFPPVSDYLRAHKIDFWPGWHPEKLRITNHESRIMNKGAPDIVVVGNFIGMSNSEFQYIREHNIPYKSYPEIVAQYIIKENSIVVAGTYGKTTISACLAWIFENAGLNPSYMSGGLLLNFLDGARATGSKWSVVEGDEYSTSRWDSRPKFAHYKPKYLVLTSTTWDHTDIYHSQEEYLEVFKQLVSSVPKDGLIVYNEHEVVLEVIQKAMCRVVRYPPRPLQTSPYQGEDISYPPLTKGGSGGVRGLETSLIGSHNLSNLQAAATLACEIGINDAVIQKSIASFKGVRRRLEVRALIQNQGQSLQTRTVLKDEEQGIMVIDDLAHSPSKARASIAAVRETYPKSRIRVVFEPNIGSRTKEALPSLQGAFDQADEIYIPRLSTAKKSEERGEWVSGEELVNYIKKSEYRSSKSETSFEILNSKFEISYIANDEDLIERLVNEAKPGDVIVFMGSHGFRGMIEEAVQRLKSNPSSTSP